MENIFLEITLIIVTASILSILFRILKQPVILAYILTGVIIGPFAILKIENLEVLRTMGQFGITFLLFMLGLELRFSELKSIGKVALVIAGLQIIITMTVGYFIAHALGFNQITCFYIAAALSFSSTIVAVKLLSDKSDLRSLYGKMSVGILLVQDFLAILVLVILSGFQSDTRFSISVVGLVTTVLKAVFLFGFILYLSRNIIPKVIDLVAKSQETLFLFSVAWVLGFSALVSSKAIGFSVEIGGFLAGLSLANSTEHYQIFSRIRPLRDFFITLFFVVLGTQMLVSNIGSVWFAAVIFSLFVLILKPLIIVIIMGILRYGRRTSFLTGLTLSQVSEFSLILIFLGNKIGHINSGIVSLVTMIGVITFSVSSCSILNSDFIYKKLNSHLKIFERKDVRSGLDVQANLDNHVVLIGAHRTGQSVLDALESKYDQIAVVDFDPDVIKKIKEKEVVCLYGDIADLDIQEAVKLEKAKLVISTIPDVNDNLLLISEIKHKNKNARIIVIAQDGREVKLLYKAGADYVVMPNLSGGRHIVKIIKEDKFDEIEEMKAKDFAYL